MLNPRTFSKSFMRRNYASSDSTKSAHLIKTEKHYAAHNYKPIPVVFERATGCLVWDPEGNQYYDFLSAYSAVNQGHCHPEIAKVMIEQLQKLTLSSRAFHNSTFPTYAKFMSELFGYESILPMNTGAEAVETAIKLARKWGYKVKGIEKDKAVVVVCENNFHGRTITIISMSNDPDSYTNYGPFTPGFMSIPHGDSASLEKLLQIHGKNVCGFLVEPIQGEAGVIIPPDGYYKEISRICKQFNVLLIADDIQAGLGRTGYLTSMEYENVRPDVVLLGKALGGGFLPISAVLSDKQHMLFEPGTHGSTYGGNALSSVVAIEALQVIQRENLCRKSIESGKILLAALMLEKQRYPFIRSVRGRGLFQAIELDPTHKFSALELCMKFKEKGLLAKPTHENIIRLAPPLSIEPHQLNECIQIISKSLREIE